MIQTPSSFEIYNREHQELTKQITEYKRINASLRKKIQARDKKINYLFSYEDHMSKSTIQNGQATGFRKNRSEIQPIINIKKEVLATDPKNKQKQNISLIQQSIFKDRTLQHGNASERINLKLPALQRKNIFVENPETTESKIKIVKIPIQKLIPLKHEQVRRKFENKFK